MYLSTVHPQLVKSEANFFPVSSWTARLPLANFITWPCYSNFSNWVCECLNLNKQETIIVLDNLGTGNCCELRQCKQKFWVFEKGGKFCSFSLVLDRQMNIIHQLEWVRILPTSGFCQWLSHELNIPS